MMARDDPGYETSIRSANSIALLMAMQQSFLRRTALQLPFIPVNRRENIYSKERRSLAKDEVIAFDIIHRFKGGNAVFMTVGGFNHDEALADEDYSILGRASLNSILKREGKLDALTGDILGIIRDDKGETVSEASAQENDSFIFTIGLEALKTIANANPVWIIATMHYKERAVKMAVEQGYANSLVIDSQIANFLIEEKKKELKQKND